MKRFAAAVGFFAALLVPATSVRASPPVQARYVCLIVLDAGRPDYIVDNIANMPNLRRLIHKGRWYNRAWAGDLLSITPVDHAVIGTGSLPRDDGGIVNWYWPHRQLHTLAPSLEDLGSFTDGYAYRLLRRSGTPSLAQLIRQKYPKDPVVAGAGAHFFAAGTMGGPYATWIYAYQDANGWWRPMSIGAHPAPSRLMNDPALRVRIPSDTGVDMPASVQPLPLGGRGRLITSFAVKTIHFYRPRALMLNFAAPDTVGHFATHWRRDIGIVYRRFDRDLGRLIAAYRDSGILSKTLFVITADHGMMRTRTRFLERHDLYAALQSVRARTYRVWDTDGTMRAIWLRNPATSALVARALFQRHIDNVSAVLYRQGQRYHYRYAIAGCESCSRNLARAYLYLTNSDAGANGEDIAILLRENTRVGSVPGVPGAHSGADWASQHITLIFSGPGVRHGISNHPARLADIAPTIERLMGIRPKARDGIVLADALARPTGPEIRRQRDSDARLGPLEKAIQVRARSDTRLERLGLIPNKISAVDLPPTRQEKVTIVLGILRHFLRHTTPAHPRMLLAPLLLLVTPLLSRVARRVRAHRLEYRLLSSTSLTRG